MSTLSSGRWRFAVVVSALAASACSGSGVPDGGDARGSDVRSGDAALDGNDPRLDVVNPGVDAIPGVDVPITTDGATSNLRPMAFRRGVNPGYYGPGIDRREAAQLSARAGINSWRGPLPESYLTMWGDRVEVDDRAYYLTLGIDHHVCFLIGPTRAHSSAPATAADWELDHYAPRNLNEPIFLPDGTVNPNNYWAAYVDRVARNYGDHIDVYEVWNEPDQVGGNWQVTEQWDTRAPAASELPWWNDTIYAYVRALRITHEVVHRVDPTGQVTVGGVGYPNFLRAVLRYTDEPTEGRVDAEHPSRGGAYLDVLSYHYYPVFGGGSSDRGADGFLESRDQMRAVLAEAGITGMNYVVTENGAPRYALGTYPGGAVYAANFLLKSFTLAHYEGFVGVDWFAQGDGRVEGASMDSFDYMGLFYNFSAANMPSEVRISPQGEAYAWLGSWFDGTAGDPDALSALALPANVRGAAFARAAGGKVYVLWARTGADESATASYALRTDREVRVRTWAPGMPERVEMRAPASGAVTLALTGTPIVVEVP